jgi:hypothetical protein
MATPRARKTAAPKSPPVPTDPDRAPGEPWPATRERFHLIDQLNDFALDLDEQGAETVDPDVARARKCLDLACAAWRKHLGRASNDSEPTARERLESSYEVWSHRPEVVRRELVRSIQVGIYCAEQDPSQSAPARAHAWFTVGFRSDLTDRLTIEDFESAIEAWKRKSGRPPRGAAKREPKWTAINRLAKLAGVPSTAPETIEREARRGGWITETPGR